MKNKAINNYSINKVAFSTLNYSAPTTCDANKTLLNKVVVVTDAENELGQLILDKCKDQGATVIAINNLQQIAERLEEIHSLNGRIDVLINNANSKETFDVADYKLNITENQWDRLYQDTMNKYFHTCQKAADLMIKDTNQGHIINLFTSESSIPTTNPFGLSEWSGVGLTKGLGMNFAKNGLVVNGISIGTSNKNEEIADLVVFLSSPKANNIIGELFILE